MLGYFVCFSVNFQRIIIESDLQLTDNGILLKISLQKDVIKLVEDIRNILP